MMLHPVICGSTNAVDPSNTSSQSVESTDGNTMQKILRSPVAMKKKLNSKTFGVPLKELSRGPNGIPDFVKKICDFLQMHGIGHEGIFRINGSSRVVDKMKAMIDRNGDTNLEEAGDVMAVASLLKMFLRELPDPVITEALHFKFINTQQAHQSSPNECVKQLKDLLQELPDEHYVVLRYLLRFLVMVSQYEATNKMNSMALAIVFGPNLFRCSVGLDGLREQGITNVIVRTLIEEYETFFKPEGKDNNSPPSSVPAVGSKCIQVQAATSKRSPPIKPVPYHEYITKKEAQKKKGFDDLKDYNSNSYSDANREEIKKAADIRDCDSPGVGLLSPRDVTSDRAFSPFNLDSETGTSGAPTPVINDVASELVEKTIQETVSQHLFGQSPPSDRDDSLTSPSPEAPVPSPRKRWQKKQEPEVDGRETNTDSPDGHSTSSTEEVFPSVQDRIRSFSSSSAPDNKSPESSPKAKRKHQPLSKAFDVFETQGIIIGPEPNGSPAKKKQSSSSGIPRIVEDPKRDRTNSRSPPSRRKAPDPPSRPSRANTQSRYLGYDSKLAESGAQGSSRSQGSPSRSQGSSRSPRSNSPRSNSPRSNSSRSNSPKSNSSASSSPKSSPKKDLPKSRSPRSKSPKSKSPRSKSPKPKSLRNFRAAADEKLAFEPTPVPQLASQSSHHSATLPTQRSAYGHVIIDAGAEFDGLSCSSPTLRSLTAGRVAPPRNRRSPSIRKGKGKSPQQAQTSQQKESSLPITEPLSIIIPSTEPLGETPDTPQDTPQPKPRRKHSNVGLDELDSAGISERPSGGLEAWIDHGSTAKSPPRSPKSHSVPPLNLTSLHEHTDGEEPIPAWKARHHFHDNNQEAMLSPRSLKLQTIAHVSHDTDVPPSPPSAQPILTGISKRADKLTEEIDLTSVKQLTKQIRTLKRKIRQYEEEFEDEHGYKPSHLHKTSQPQIKKMMGELKRANKQLKEAKEEAAKAKVPLSRTLPLQVTCGRNLTQRFDEEESAMTSLETALCETETRLEEKRGDASRPEDIYTMNKQQVQDEKTAIQKALLQMESKFGRPSTKETKELMKPLYDRYRNIKKLLIKLDFRQPDDGQSSLDLQTIKEHEETKEFQPKQMGEVHNLYSTTEDDAMQTTDFNVTQDVNRRLITADLDDGYGSPADSRRSSSGGREELTIGSVDAASNLHEASLSELLTMQNQSREDKKRLRKVLKEFEDDFFKKLGRYVQKEDRVPMETEYNEYKHLKKHLKLLEALVAKHQPPGEEIAMPTV